MIEQSIGIVTVLYSYVGYRDAPEVYRSGCGLVEIALEYGLMVSATTWPYAARLDVWA